MLALVKTQKGKGFLELQEKPEPRPGKGEVLLEIKATGICGTDLHVRDDGFPYWPPVILGHEFSGEIVELGPDCKYYQVGERVVGEPHTKACGVCHLCRTGNPQICPDKRSPGWGIDGSFCKYLVMPEHLLHRIPENIDYDTAAVFEPGANAVHDVIERGRLEPGDFVVVVGPGPIGLLAAMAANAGGARHVVIAGTPSDEGMRLEKARQLGFDSVINVAETNLKELVMDLTHGVGADMAIDCSGAPRAIAGMPDLVRKKGRLLAIGLTGGRNVDFPWNTCSTKSLDVHFGMSTSYTSWNKVIALTARGLMPIHEVISHRMPLTDWEKAFEEIEAQRALKVILHP